MVELEGGHGEWMKMCRRLTLEHDIRQWQAETENRSTLGWYCFMKSFPSPERFLTNPSNRQGRWLKLEARAGILPVASRIRILTRSADVDPSVPPPPPVPCAICGGDEETVQHFIMNCGARVLSDLRMELVRMVSQRLCDSSKWRPVADWFTLAIDFDRFCFLLGSDMRYLQLPRQHPLPSLFVDPDLVAAVDSAFRNYLLLAWRARERIVGFVDVRHRVAVVVPRPVGRRSETSILRTRSAHGDSGVS